MNKKALIALFVLLIILAFGMGFLKWKSVKKAEMAKQVAIQQQEEEAKKQNSITNKLSEEEIQKLKNDKTLVWYEVPELGVQFQVTAYGKKALAYKRIYSLGENINSLIFVDSMNEKNNNLCHFMSKEIHEDDGLCDDGVFYLFSMKSYVNERSKKPYIGAYYFCGSNKIVKSLNDNGGGMILKENDNVICLNGFDENKYFKEYGIVLSSFKPLDLK
ncbi:MAG: hypothetical protein NTY33_00400 [Candidatus Moranbacteria bacterium]|nr:hypothetical protein [Candidatus Moranbacteria bacterium]